MKRSRLVQSKNGLKVKICVDVTKTQGNFSHPWTYIGYDECNWTYSPGGKAVLAKLGKLKDGPYFMRTHHLLCSGNCLGSFKWGSTNVYREDEKGNPVYDWAVIDRIFDTYLQVGCKPFVELGFMPKDLTAESSAPSYKEGGWKYPPKDYHKWYNLIYQLVKHCVDRYGQEEVSLWYWELWNEPDIPYYWKGSIEEYCKLYDYTASAVKSAFPASRVGGPAVTGPARHEAREWLDRFLDHCINETNYYTGKKGTPLDFVSFHAKGGGFPRNLQMSDRRPSVRKVIEDVQTGLKIISKYDGLLSLPCILSECDTDGWAAGTISDNPNLFFRNTEYYPGFVASMVKKIMNLNEVMQANICGILTWAFYFESKEYFKGFRSLATHNIDKPILNLFRLYGLMGNTRLKLESNGAQNPLKFDDTHTVNKLGDVDGLAFMAEDGQIEVMVWNHHDDWEVKDEKEVEVEIKNLPFAGNEIAVSHYRIDQFYSNSHTEWQKLGSPRVPSSTQIADIKSHAGLEMIESKTKCHLVDGKFRKIILLPTHGISLLVVSPLS